MRCSLLNCPRQIHQVRQDHTPPLHVSSKTETVEEAAPTHLCRINQAAENVHAGKSITRDARIMSGSCDIRILTAKLNPAEAELWVEVDTTYHISNLELRGQVSGPRCAYSSTVE